MTETGQQEDVLRVSSDGASHLREDPEPEERLFHRHAFRGGRMLTVAGSAEARTRASKALRAAFLGAGYGGIFTPESGGEVVVFDLGTIRSLRRVGPDEVRR